jgi:hypothetical protein
LLPAPPAFAGVSHAQLRAFRSVDAEKTNPLAVDLYCVAVDDGGDADDAFLRDRARRDQDGEQQADGKANRNQEPSHR